MTYRVPSEQQKLCGVSTLYGMPVASTCKGRRPSVSFSEESSRHRSADQLSATTHDRFAYVQIVRCQMFGARGFLIRNHTSLLRQATSCLMCQRLAQRSTISTYIFGHSARGFIPSIVDGDWMVICGALERSVCQTRARWFLPVKYLTRRRPVHLLLLAVSPSTT